MDLHADFFEVRADLLDFLQQVVRALFELLFLRVHIADGDGQIRGLLVEAIGDVVVGGLVAQLIQARNLELVGLACRFRAAESAGASATSSSS